MYRLPLVLLMAAGVFRGDNLPAAAETDARRSIVAGYASWCHHLYTVTERKAVELQRAVDDLIEHPSPTTLNAARTAWTHARREYGRTEVFRFYNGPIEELEPLVNSWPVDEAYMDAVAGRPDSGIINDLVHFPTLSQTMLTIANERGGEANISLGWHAIEFLLWGQDLDAKGPGNRPFSDFVDNAGRNAARRCEYLKAATALLVQHLGTLKAAWAPGEANYRRSFENDAERGLRDMLTGSAVLTAFELEGERLAVAYETRDAEQEHSCFSDTTTQDLVANQLGIVAVLTGASEGDIKAPGLLEYLRARRPDAAALLESALAETTTRIRAIPAPFDQAFLGDDETVGRRAIRAAMEALERQAEAIVLAGLVLGYELPLEPEGG
jgi:putative iron-regulated protein